MPNTYFIANSGSSGNSGLSSSFPKATYAQALAASAGNPDTFLGFGQDIFRETATANGNGQTFGAYGIGTPILHAADISTGWATAGVGTNTFSVTDATTVRQLFKNGTRCPLGASASTLNEGEMFWAANVLYFRSNAGNPDSLGLVMEASHRDYNFNQNGKSGVSINSTTGKAAQHSSNSAFYFSGIGAVDNWDIDHCFILDSYTSGAIVHAASTGGNFTFNQVLRAGQHALWGDTADDHLNVALNDNIITDCGWRTDPAINFPSGLIGGWRSGEIGWNTFRRQGLGGSGGHAHAIYCGQDRAPGLTLNVHDNDIDTVYNGAGIKCTQDANIYSNRITNATSGGINPGQNSGTNNATITSHHNYIYNCCTIGGAGIDVRNGGSTGTLSFKSYHDTFYNNSGANSGGEINVETNLALLDIRNAIMYASSYANATYIRAVTQTGTRTVDYNVYYGSPSATPFNYGSTSMSLATWKTQAFTPDAHALTSNPLFKNTTSGDFSLQALSPAIDSAVRITGINDVYFGTAPDRGAFEVTMADTVRTVSALQTILADNTTGNITPQNLRDMLVSLLSVFGGTITGPLTTTNISAPSAPAAGNVSHYSALRNARAMPYMMNDAGKATSLMASIFDERLALLTCRGDLGAPSGIGVNTNASGTVGGSTFATTNKLTQSLRTTWTSAAAINSAGGITTFRQFSPGSVGGFGGFDFKARVTHEANVAGSRWFFGLAASTSPISTGGEPGTVTTAKIGVGLDSTDTNFQLVYNATGGAPTKVDLGIARTTGLVGFDIQLYSPSNAVGISYVITNVLTGSVLASGTLTTLIPVNTDSLAFHCAGFTLAATTAVVAGMTQMVCTTDN